MNNARHPMMLGLALLQMAACGAESDSAGPTGSGSYELDGGVAAPDAAGGNHAGNAGSSPFEGGLDAGSANAPPAAEAGSGGHDAGAAPDAPVDGTGSATPDAASLSCEGSESLFNNVNPGHCDGAPYGDACAEQSQTTFTLKKRSVVHTIRTYVGQNGMSANSFSYKVKQAGTTVLSGDMKHLTCTAGTEWCFFGDESMNQVLEPGSYVLSVSWPRICANPTSGCQGFVQVMGCTESE
jgi:hypothetical protein